MTRQRGSSKSCSAVAYRLYAKSITVGTAAYRREDGGKISRQLVLASTGSAILFQPAEHSLDDVSLRAFRRGGSVAVAALAAFELL